MSDELIPCTLEVSFNGDVKVMPVRPVNLRPGESMTISANPPQAIVHRVWFGHRWYVAIRAYLTGIRGPTLEVTCQERQDALPEDPLSH